MMLEFIVTIKKQFHFQTFVLYYKTMQFILDKLFLSSKDQLLILQQSILETNMFAQNFSTCKQFQ